MDPLTIPASSQSQRNSNKIVFEDLTLSDMTSITAIPGNDKCMDCGYSRPEWASLGFGILVCLDCAGYHRSLGAHISLVRSLKMDSWSQVQKTKLMQGGNKKFADYLNSRNISSVPNDPALMHKKYLLPTVLYYREIIQAVVENRKPASYDPIFWTQVASPTKSKSEIAAKSPKWFPDEEASECQLCGLKFTLLTNRRHHCRRCGKCVCKTCAPSKNTRPIMEWGLMEPVRHCKECFMSPALSWG